MFLMTTFENEHNSEMCLEPCQTLYCVFYEKIVICLKLLTIFAKCSIKDVLNGPKYGCLLQFELVLHPIIVKPINQTLTILFRKILMNFEVGIFRNLMQFEIFGKPQRLIDLTDTRKPEILIDSFKRKVMKQSSQGVL